MAYVVMACVAMAYVVMACVVMAYVVMACVVMAYVVMACVVMAYVVMAYVVMAHVVMAYVVMAYVDPPARFMPWVHQRPIYAMAHRWAWQGGHLTPEPCDERPALTQSPPLVDARLAESFEARAHGRRDLAHLRTRVRARARARLCVLR